MTGPFQNETNLTEMKLYETLSRHGPKVLTYKYVRMTRYKPSSSAASATSLFAYSIAWSGAWILQGPTTTSTRESLPSMMLAATFRALLTVFLDVAEASISDLSRAG